MSYDNLSPVASVSQTDDSCRDPINSVIDTLAALSLDDPVILNIQFDSSQDHIPSAVQHILKKACGDGAVNIVKFILKNLTEKQKKSIDRSVLEVAIAQSGNREIVKCLQDVGICRTDLAGNGDTDILLAVRYNRRKILESFLTEQGSYKRINQPNNFGVFPLYLAVKLKQVDCLKLLVEAGADVCQKIENSDFEKDDLSEMMESLNLYEHEDKLAKASVGDSLIHIVLKKLGLRVFYKNVQEYFVYENIFEIFLNTEIDVTVTDGRGHSLLDEAIISLCDVRILDRLLEKGCDILLPNPYHYACFEDSVERLEVIKSLGFKVNSGSNETQFSPLFVACLDQNVKVVHWLLDNGANPTTYADSQVLCDWIANVNRFADDDVLDRDNYVTRMTPLHFTLLGSLSVFMSAIPIVEALCNHGVDVNAQTSSGETPLFYATRDLLGEDNFPVLPSSFEEFGAEESLFILLIEAGGDPDIGSNQSTFPITFCIQESLTRIALMFLEVSTNLSKYMAVEENQRKACHISDFSFLPLSKDTLKALVQNPRKLKVLCRKTILNACRGRHINNEGSLSALPKAVLNYVTLKHLTDNEWYQKPDTLQ